MFGLNRASLEADSAGRPDDSVRKLLWRNDVKRLSASGPAACEPDGIPADSKHVGEKTDQVKIGLAVHGWRGDPDAQGIAVLADNLVPMRAWLNLHVQQEGVVTPPVEHQRNSGGNGIR